MPADLKTFYYEQGQGLSRERVAGLREQFAARAGTTVPYIERKLLRTDPTKRPDVRTKLMQALADASDGALTYDDMLDYFYREKNKDAA